MAEIGIFVGTMYGNSLLVAEEAEAILARQGHSATVLKILNCPTGSNIRIRLRWSLPRRPGRAIYRIALRRSFTALKIRWVFSQTCVTG